MSFVKIHEADNVGVAISDLARGEVALGVTLLDDIPQGHKFALTDIPVGQNVIKYGYPIGHVTVERIAGQLIDDKSLKTNLSGIDSYVYTPTLDASEVDECALPSSEAPTFLGYERPDGRVGVRNEIWIIPTVGCVNATCRRLARMLTEQTGFEAVHAFEHNFGCSQLGDDHENTRRILADLVRHPNAGGVLVVGLGCENNQLADLRTLIGPVDESRIKFMECQKVDDELATGIALLREIHEVVIRDKREPFSVSKLTIGLKCGGSDGLSGITANPLLGRFADWLVAQGGSVVLTEVPEMFGSETILLNRCIDHQTFDRAVSMINSFKQYFIDNHQPVSENPSPGNKRGGISTLEEKSLGCTQKAGTSPVVDILSYGDRIKESGLSLLWAPGNDIVATTALAAAGCQIILFTTGRGTPLGSFVPTIKVATNTPLASHKPSWIDFNAGAVASESTENHDSPSPQSIDTHFIDLVLAVANGQQTRNETNGYRDMAIFKSGVTL